MLISVILTVHMLSGHVRNHWPGCPGPPSYQGHLSLKGLNSIPCIFITSTRREAMRLSVYAELWFFCKANMRALSSWLQIRLSLELSVPLPLPRWYSPCLTSPSCCRDNRRAEWGGRRCWECWLESFQELWKSDLEQICVLVWYDLLPNILETGPEEAK